MNRTKCVGLMIVVSLLGIFSVNAQKRKDTRNVIDYYKLLKSEMVALPLIEKPGAGFETKVAVRDTKNGYLKLEGAYDGYVEVSLFRKKNRKALLVVGETGCGPACSTELSAFELVRGRMVNVTKKVMPKFYDGEVEAKLERMHNDIDLEHIDILEKLPRYGRTIKVVADGFEAPLFELEWKNDRFVIQREVLDYYYVFPASAIHPENKRKTEILVHDVKNGYVKLKVPVATIEIALFRRGNTPVLFVVENYCGTGRCVTSEMEVRELVDGKWRDIEKEVFPSWLNEARIHSKSKAAAKRGYQYKLPRIGRTVKIVEGDDGKAIYKFNWNGQRFRVTR